MPGRKVKSTLDAKVTIRLPRALLRAMDTLATREHRSLNGQILHAIEAQLAAQEKARQNTQE